MKDEEKILTLHPKGKAGVNLVKRRYDIIRSFILDTITEKGEISFEVLTDLAIEKLTNSFYGKVIWYMVTVKLDLEARKLIERISKTSPHKLRLFTGK